MQTTTLRKVGGSVMLAVPPALLDALHLAAGAKVGLAVDNGRLVVEPQPRPRYTLAELGGLGLFQAAAAGGTRMGGRPGRGAREAVRRGDIYLVSLDPTEGHEQKGRRPVLVVSPAEFNEATRLPVILPIISGGEFARRIGFAVPISGVKTTGVVRCDQPRVLDLHARNGRKVDALPQALMDEVLAKVVTIFE